MRSEQAMTPQELAGEVAETVALAQSRITGIGADQYHEVATGRQKFEDMPLDALIEYAEEEALDLINYAVMARIRYARVRQAIAAWYRADRPTVVCLCGSTRFKAEFIEANFRETMAGRIVLSVGWYSHADNDVYNPTAAEKADLDRLHLRKIDLADELLVVDVGGYVGESTAREIAHAASLGKRIRRWSEESPWEIAALAAPAGGEKEDVES
jgi:hypothetical protein